MILQECAKLLSEFFSQKVCKISWPTENIFIDYMKPYIGVPLLEINGEIIKENNSFYVHPEEIFYVENLIDMKDNEIQYFNRPWEEILQLKTTE